jgi:hypothetical protein
MRNIFDKVGYSGPAQSSTTLTVAVPAEIHRMGSISMLDEVIEKVLIPAPGSVQHSMYEKDGR